MLKTIIITSFISLTILASLYAQFGINQGDLSSSQVKEETFSVEETDQSTFETEPFGGRTKKNGGPPGNPDDTPLSDYSVLLLGLSALFFIKRRKK